jgi:hypothetical protein
MDKSRNSIPVSRKHFAARGQLLQRLGTVKKWVGVSDYAYDPNKPNHVISFTFIPHVISIDVFLPQ